MTAVQECHDLIKVLTEQKAGSQLNQKTASPAETDGKVKDSDGDELAAEALLHEGTEAGLQIEEDPLVREAEQWASAEGDHVHVFTKMAELKDKLQQDVPSHTFVFSQWSQSLSLISWFCRSCRHK